MGLTIKDPVGILDLMCSTFRTKFNSDAFSNVIVDDVENVLKAFLGQFGVKSINTIAISNNDPSDELI